MMKLILNKEEKRQLGFMLRYYRIKNKMTQQQLVEKCNHLLSLRTLISLEKGNCIKDDDIYDTLLTLFQKQYQYNEQKNKQLEALYASLLEGYQKYDHPSLREVCNIYIDIFKHDQSYVPHCFVVEALKRISGLWCEKTFLTLADYTYFSETLHVYDRRLQMIILDALYAYEYQHTHHNKTLESIFVEAKKYEKYLVPRFCLGIVLHLVDKHNDYLNAYVLLLKLEKKADIQKCNPHIMFHIYSWKANVASRILPLSFPTFANKAEALLKNNYFTNREKHTFYVNMAVSYYMQRDFMKARDYYKLAIQYPLKHMLPQLIWYYNMQYHVDKTLPSYEEYDVSNCSEQLQKCWHYFVMKQEGASALVLEAYIMKELMGYLKHMAKEFSWVYLLQLNDLVKETRNYKNVMLFMNKLNIFRYI